MCPYNFKIFDQEDIDWEKIESCNDHTVFKSKEWMNFLFVTQNIKRFVVGVFDNSLLIGFFIGELFCRVFRVVASPFEGWTTDYQGLSMLITVSVEVRINIYKALISYLFKNRICSVFQVSDWQLDIGSIKDTGLKYEIIKGYSLDLSQTEEQLYKKFSPRSCQYAIKKSQKCGVIIRESANTDQFAEHYYNQLLEVFEKQGMRPTYDANRVRAMINQLKYSDKLLLLEAQSSDGICLATGIFVGDNQLAYLWGAASYSRYQNLCPNEPIIYEAIRHWKRKGYKYFDLGGIRKYKEKYGPVYFEKPKIIASKYYGLLELKGIAKKTYFGIRQLGAQFFKISR